MAADEYLWNILAKYKPNLEMAQKTAASLFPTIQKWANKFLIEAIYSGSIAKGTTVSMGSDADIFVSISSLVQETLSQVYETLNTAFLQNGYTTRKQNVSIRVFVGPHKIDVTPGKRQGQQGYDHSIYLRKADSWTKTNVKTHVTYVSNSNRLSEIKLLKVWRELHKIDFPSFYLEMVSIDCLKNSKVGNIGDNLWAVLGFLSDGFSNARYVDPANSANIISDDLTKIEKASIANFAKEARQQTNWGNIIW
jgi:hypothetical protein